MIVLMMIATMIMMITVITTITSTVMTLKGAILYFVLPTCCAAKLHAHSTT